MISKIITGSPEMQRHLFLHNNNHIFAHTPYKLCIKHVGTTTSLVTGDENKQN